IADGRGADLQARVPGQGLRSDRLAVLDMAADQGPQQLARARVEIVSGWVVLASAHDDHDIRSARRVRNRSRLPGAVAAGATPGTDAARPRVAGLAAGGRALHNHAPMLTH